MADQRVASGGAASGWSRGSSALAGFISLALIQAWLIFSHSPWFDEEHALLIARAPWADLVGNLKYEGHPALWYLWLGLIDRILGGSAWSLPVAQTPISLGLLALIWFRAPFPFTAKLLLSLSYFVSFEYGVISRSYGLGALLLLAAVSWRKSWVGWLCLALAANTAVHAALVAAALGGVFFLDRPNRLGVFLLGLGGIAAALTVFPVAADLFPTGAGLAVSTTEKVFLALRLLSAVLVQNVPSWPCQWPNYLPVSQGALVGLIVLPLAIVSLRKAPTVAMAFALVYFGLLVLAVRAYELSPRHVGMLFILLVCGWWMIAEAGKLGKIAWGWLAVAAVCGLPFMFSAHVQPFSHHREIAAWIKAQGLDGETWGAWPGRQGVAISAHFGTPTINLEKDCLNTFVRWDYPHEKVVDPLSHVRATGVRYVISESEIPGGRALATFGKGFGYEWPVTLYAFDGTPRPIPACR